MSGWGNQEKPARGVCNTSGATSIEVYSVVPENIDTPPMDGFWFEKPILQEIPVLIINISFFKHFAF